VNCCDLEYPAIYSAEKVKARKAHVCDDCLGKIQAGEVYKNIAGLWDGSWSNFKECQDCSVVRCDLGKLFDDACDCIPHGSLMESILEACHDYEEAVMQPILSAFNAASKTRGGRSIKGPWEGGRA